MRRRIAITITAALAVAACGAGAGDGGPVTTSPVGSTTAGGPTATTGPGRSTSTTGASPTTAGDEVGQRQVEVYFIQDGAYARAVSRSVPATPAVAANTMRALLAGPSAAETEEGLSSAIPADTLLLGIDIDDGVATVDLSSEFEQGGGSFALFSRLGQVVYTLTELDSVDEVVFWIDGEPVTVFSGEGILLEGPVDRSDYTSALPLTATTPRWGWAELPSIVGVPVQELGRVVLVVADDVLNVRSGPGLDHPIIGMLEPGVIVRRTGERSPVGSSSWARIGVPGGTGWVNDRYLAAVVTGAEVESDPAVIALLDRLTAIMAAGGDLTQVVSDRGLYVAHNAPPIHFPPDQLDTVMTESTTYRWGSAALEPGSPELPSMTFAQAVGRRFVSTYDDADTSIQFNQVELGGNGTLAERAIPFELAGFNFVSVYDPGDDPQYGGLDWTAWYASIDYEDGHPVIVGLTLNEWSP